MPFSLFPTQPSQSAQLTQASPPQLIPTHTSSTSADHFDRDLEGDAAIVAEAPIRNDSGVGASPTMLPRAGYKTPHQHRIIPPSITGHGRLIIAHRTVPYWVGLVFVVGVFFWAVWCAIYLYPLLGGHSNDWKSGN
jgi:hypothetical protein